MIRDRNNALHDTRTGRYTHKEAAPSAVTLEAPAAGGMDSLRDSCLGMEEEARIEESGLGAGDRIASERRPSERRTFDGYLNMAERFMNEHGRVPSHRRETSDESTLYNWMTRLRAQDRAGNLSDEQKAKLNELPLDILPKTVTQEFEEKFISFQKFMDETGRTPEPLDTGHGKDMYKFMRDVRVKATKPEHEERFKKLVARLRPEAAEALLGKTNVISRKDAVRERNIDKVIAWLDEHQRHPSAYAGPEEAHVRETLQYLREHNRKTPEKLARLSAHAVYREYPDGVYEDLRLLNGQAQRAEMVAGWNKVLEERGTGALAHLRANEPKLYSSAMAVQSRKRTGADVHTYLEVDQALEKLFGPEWDKPARGATEKQRAAMRANAKQKTDELRDFMATSNGRRPSRYKKEEIHMMGWIRSRQLKARSPQGLDQETMDEFNEILGIGWEKVRSPKARTTS